MSTSATELRGAGGRAEPAAASQGVPGALQTLLTLVSELAVVTTRTGEIVLTNRAWETMLGWTPGELIGRSVFDMVHPDDQAQTRSCAASSDLVADFINRYRHRDGTWRRLQWRGRRDGEYWYAVSRDVTEQLTLERRALYDDLTQLGNRGLLIDQLGAALRRLAGDEDRVLAVLFVDLDGFKLVNDGLGHEAGDRLLVEVARRLREVVRGADLITRFGGDEFVIVSEGLSRDADAVALGERIVSAVGREYPVGSHSCTLSCCVGIAITRDPGRPAERLLHEADTAMYRGKTLGSGRVEVYDQRVRREVAARLLIERGLREALRRDELVLEYQPVVAVPEGTLTGCEALVRWRHPERGLVLPGEFIPVAEATGLIREVGAQVLEMACRQAGEWRRSGFDLTVSVNVSRRELLQPGFVDRVQAALRSGGVPGQMLCMEVTETAAAGHAWIVDVLHGIRELGIKIALDDFGAGYSTLANLRELPIDVIKIDRSFIAGVDGSSDNREIVAAVLALARELGIAVIAEGVETEDQLLALKRMGCRMAQGFLFGASEPPEQFARRRFSGSAQPGLGDAFVIREFMRQIGIPARIER